MATLLSPLARYCPIPGLMLRFNPAARVVTQSEVVITLFDYHEIIEPDEGKLVCSIFNGSS
jgi:hypothetical protein